VLQILNIGTANIGICRYFIGWIFACWNPRWMSLRVPYWVLGRPVVAFTAELLLSRVANQSTQSTQGRRLIELSWVEVDWVGGHQYQSFTCRVYTWEVTKHHAKAGDAHWPSHPLGLASFESFNAHETPCIQRLL